ncbi:hypothetical protein [Vibrio neptunius]|uniref:hypothetical protein n=1 Tax=Vibrio neptunius TaxID=170651 RepID=UPI001C5C89E3|nr:hypothetical protein [Vibrio neptunius]QXX07653.1 hypothetical protein KW548_06690 [Vibrio neptunius]
MQLYKFVASIALLTGCAAQANTEQTITDWVAKTEKCLALSEASEASFPDNSWFQSLDVEKKKGVTFYLYQEKLYGCSKRESDALMQSLTQSENKTLIKFFAGLGAFEKPDSKFIAGVDSQQLQTFSNSVEVFNLRKVGKELNF